MVFNKLLEDEKIHGTEVKVNYREAVRAIIIQDENILLVHSNQGDYKFAGGGVEKNESHAEALLREIAEETGYIRCIVKEKAGVVIERNVDEYEEGAYFQMTSHYYFCELIDGIKVNQKLDDYELEQEFMPEWVSIEYAIEQNEKAMKQRHYNGWIKRENFVLHKLSK
ncbi:NUDIX hydrolase [Bacillus manliponensis]|uniref:NUDIX hydrolase n=1 Tax=Bacillus manliponensis TaxID=574376 RepID=A0A073KEE4_9BACI|nr:NUDIX domain-containing protein [Bacillus manliponensis]KEK20693.1 NUDIX hydrolase [Bacillus manliponensis]